jgi:hypothetical protein
MISNCKIEPRDLALMISDKERQTIKAMALSDGWSPPPAIQGLRTSRILSNLSDRYQIFDKRSGQPYGGLRFRPRPIAYSLQALLRASK